MVLSFTALDKKGQFRSFCCQLTKLEVALDVLSTVSAQGDVLVTAQLTDEGNRMELPVEVFDGEPLSKPLHQLEEQWQAILDEPIQAVSATTSWRVEVAHRQIRLYDQRIDQFTDSINCLEELRRLAETRMCTESRRMRLVSRYDTMLGQYYDYMERAKANQCEIQQKLSQLVHS